MADVFDFYVRDNRKINFEIAEPIMREDSGVTDFRFHIPKTLNGLEVSDWSWWFVFLNAKKEKYSVALTLSDDPESPLEYNLATYTVDYAMSIKAGNVQFALEAINAGTGGAIDNEWHTLTYETKVKETLQGNQAEYTETESDIISELLQTVRNKVNQLVGGATPEPKQTVAQMTDPEKIYLYTGTGDYNGYWYYHNGTQFVPGGLYGAGVQIDPTLTQPEQAADAKVVWDRFADVFKTVDGLIETPGITNGTWANGGATAGGNRGRTTSLIRCKGKISFGLGDYSKYKFGYMIYTSADLSQYTNSGWVTADVSNLDFSGYAIGFNFAHLSGSGAIPASELEEIHNLFSISVTGQMLTVREEIETLQSDVASLKSAESAHENNLLPQIGANPFRFNPCYDHLFVNSKTDAVIPHESLYHVRLSKKMGFTVIEANVSATSDGVYVVNHLENYKFGGYFHHVDGTTDISDILLSSVTWDWVVANVRYNSTITKYQTRPCRLEEFLQECRQQGLIPFITSSDTNVIAIADAYMGKDNYIAYGASRTDCPNAIIYHFVSNLTTKEDILAYCESIGKPFIFGLGNVTAFTDAELKELVGTLHENGYMIGIAYSDNNWHKYAAYGFDVNATIRHINRIEKGNLCNLNSIFDFSDFEYTNATLSNGVLTFSSAGTIKPKIENASYSLCGFDVEFDMTGTVTIPAVGEQKSSYNLTSDGSYPVFCATPIINGSPAITINVASGTVIKDVYFKASVFAGLVDVPVVDSVPTQGSTNAVSSGGVYDALHDTDTTLNYLLDYTVIDEESMSGTFHDDENIYGVKVSGSANAFTNILLANKKNLIPDLNIVTETKNGITFSGGGRFWNVSGTSTASASKSTTPDFVSTDIPAGTYIVRVYRSGSYTASDNPYFSIVGKKADNSTVTIGSFYLNANLYREWTKTISSDIVSVRVVFAVANGTAITDTLKLWICMFPSDVTITDTGETVESGATKTLDISRATYSDGVDTMQHASVALYNPKIQGYVEDYVSNNIPEGVLTESIIPFITPEMYGAKGDGNTDDTAALQACINAASSSLSNNIPLRGYGKYKVSSPLRIGGYYLDIFIKTITYTGSNVALIISGKNSKFEFDEIIASESGACGIRVQSAPDENVKYTGFDSNVLKVNQRIYANGNALEMIRSSDATEGLMYNDFNIHKLHSSNANCIYATATGNFEENDIRGQYFSAPNGYAYYGATPYTHTTRLFDFCIEHTVKNGIFGGANLYRVRTTECMNHYTEEEPDRGRIFVFDGFFPRSYADRDTRVSLLSLDADNAKSWDDIINDVRDYYDNNPDVAPITAFNKVWMSSNFYSTFEFCDMVAESGFAGSTAILPRGKAFVYYNHVAFKPDVEWYESISDATYIISLERTQASAQKYITPTFFDINVANSSIYLDWSYCCLAINKFTVRQYADKKAKVYDKFGTLIFDGTNQAEGDYVFNCVKKNIDENVTMRDGTVLDWSAVPYHTRDIYSGANELWKIEKFNTIA